MTTLEILSVLFVEEEDEARKEMGKYLRLRCGRLTLAMVESLRDKGFKQHHYHFDSLV